ncbi:unnamed protein product [Strongylus vulgaris]|uniref:Uncharacterized protein n=1 Tax=Strongylus vulgaris TaxID=40348 RepID=A0A3P7JE96_STRVU|nr:unnamed protein product [Strongylus vulgaris]
MNYQMSVYFQQQYYRHPLHNITYYQRPGPQRRVEADSPAERRERPLYRGMKEEAA